MAIATRGTKKASNSHYPKNCT